MMGVWENIYINYQILIRSLEQLCAQIAALLVLNGEEIYRDRLAGDVLSAFE